MKKWKHNLIGVSVLICLLSASIALGASSRNTATITWGSPATGNLTPISSWSSGKSRGRAANLYNPSSVSFTVHEPSSGFISYAYQETAGSYGEGETTTTTLSADSKTLAINPGDVYSGEATAVRGEGYQVGVGGGEVVFSLQYLLDMNVDPTGGDAYGYTNAWCDLLRVDSNNQWVTAVSRLDADGTSPTFGLTYTASAGEYLLFRAGVGSLSSASMAAVPLPGAVWLLGSGLLSLLGIRRKK